MNRIFIACLVFCMVLGCSTQRALNAADSLFAGTYTWEEEDYDLILEIGKKRADGTLEANIYCDYAGDWYLYKGFMTTPDKNDKVSGVFENSGDEPQTLTGTVKNGIYTLDYYGSDEPMTLKRDDASRKMIPKAEDLNE